MSCSSCNNCLSREEVINLINNTTGISTTNTSVPIGAVVWLTSATYASSANFDISGKGSGAMNCWAIANGNNGTQNLTGRVLVARNLVDVDFDVIGETGGSKTHTLATTEIPSHSHGYTLVDHNHTVTDSGHTHTATTNNQLGAGLIAADGGGTYNVTNGAISTDIFYADINVTQDALTNTVGVEFLVRSIPSMTGNLNGSGTQAVSGTQGTSSVVIPTHDHGNPDLTHDHTVSVASGTTGVTVDSTTAGSSEVTSTTTGGGGSHNNLQPYFVAVPIQRIC